MNHLKENTAYFKTIFLLALLAHMDDRAKLWLNRSLIVQIFLPIMHLNSMLSRTNEYIKSKF